MNLKSLNIFQILSFALVLLVSGCAKTSIDEIPSYLSIDTISITVTPLQGTSSQKIFDAWVYADNILIGGFELPKRFPLLKEGTTELSIFAGIKLNGINELRVPYPFYQKITKTVELEREQVLDLGHLKFAYASATKFAWQEDFEESNLSIDTTARSEINLNRIFLQDELHAAFPYETNQYAARVIIPNDSLMFECASHDSYKLPVDGTSVFMELNYKSNNPFTVGLIANGLNASQNAVLVVNPSSTWNKIYINFTPTLSTNTSASSFRVFIAAMKETSETKAEIYFDNIKLLHF